jgi:hypothetical protein
MHCRDTRELEPLTDADLNAHWHMTELLLQQALHVGPTEEVLFKLVLMAARKIKGVRCSLVRTITHSQGVVVASSDDQKISGLAVDLNKYPEIQLVMHTGKMIAIDNLENSRALAKIKAEFKKISFNSLIVCPVTYRGKPFGVLSMRMAADKLKLTDEQIRFVDVVAKIASLSLGAQNIGDMTRFGLISA